MANYLPKTNGEDVCVPNVDKNEKINVNPNSNQDPE